MKKIMLTVCLVLGLLIAPIAMADQVATVGGYGPYQYGQGGEFTINILSGLGGVINNYVPGKTSNFVVTGTFQTFCVEDDEYIYPNTTFDFILNTKAIYGSAPGIGDPLSKGAAWLYSQFARGTLANFNYGDGRTGAGGSTDLLQRAIWWLEGEEGEVYNAANPFELAVVTKFGSGAAAMASQTNNEYGVMVLNLYENGSLRQDLLVYVPEPGILILLGIALSAIGLVARRRKF